MSNLLSWAIPTAAAATVVTIPAVPLTSEVIATLLLASVSGIAWLIHLGVMREKQLTKLEMSILHLTNGFIQLQEQLAEQQEELTIVNESVKSLRNEMQISLHDVRMYLSGVDFRNRAFYSHTNQGETSDARS